MSSLVVSGFEKMVLKYVRVIQKEGKKPLIFVHLVDAQTFENTGDLIFLKQDITLDEIGKLKSLEMKPVKAVISVNEFNGRTSFVVTDIKSI